MANLFMIKLNDFLLDSDRNKSFVGSLKSFDMEGQGGVVLIE